MSTQINDAHVQSPSHSPPSTLPTSGSTSSSHRVIDLSSPARPGGTPQRTPGLLSERPHFKSSRRSEDELRLVGDYSTPADAVACPDPQSWDPSSRRHLLSTMKPKPGAKEAYRPINTLAETTLGATKAKTVTYSKSYRSARQPIGRTRFEGQIAYLEAVERTTSAVAARPQASCEAWSYRERGPSPVKRRKTEHVVEIDDDEEEDHISAFYGPKTAANAIDASRPSRPSSRSQVSTGSGRSWSATKPPFKPQSEFLATDSLCQKGKKVRHQDIVAGQGRGRSSSYASSPVASPVWGSKHAGPIALSDDEQPPLRRQGTKPLQQVGKVNARRREVVTSHHFPNAQINESTSEKLGQFISLPSSPTKDTNLRNMHRPASHVAEEVDDSPDELAMSDGPGPILKSNTVVSKAVQTVDDNNKRDSRLRSKGPGLQLKFARSSCFARHNSDLRLKPGIDKNCSIIGHDLDYNSVFVGSFDLGLVQTILADDSSRIRLSGGRDQDGNIERIDLEFVHKDEFLFFRDDYAVPMSGLLKFTHIDEKSMQSRFEKPLIKNDKTGKSPASGDMGHTQRIGSSGKRHASYGKGPDSEPLEVFASGELKLPRPRKAASGMEEDVLVRPARISTRSTRSTAASSSLFDADLFKSREVEKYSIEHGLGPPWKKPLEYGQGRQRATVHFEDLSRLDEEEFLNDSLIDFYMIYLFHQYKVPSDKVYFFNTYFFTALTKNTGRQSMNYENVARWTAKVDIFGYDYIVVPINEATHWYLAIMCNVSNIARKPVIEDFDNENKTLIEKTHRDTSLDVTEQHAIEFEDASEQAPSSSPVNAYGESLKDSEQQRAEKANLFEDSLQQNPVDPNDTRALPGTDITGSDDSNFSRSDANVYADSSTTDVVTKSPLSPSLAVSNLKKATKRKFMQAKKDPDQPIVIILDSLGQTRSGAVRALKDWLSAEGKAKRGMEAVIKEKGYYPKHSQIPTQDNWSDCGVYLLGYVDKFFQNPDQFRNRLLAGEMSAEKDWPELEPKQMRSAMRTIIFECANNQKQARIREKQAKLRAKQTNSSAPTNLEGSLDSAAQDHSKQSPPPTKPPRTTTTEVQSTRAVDAHTLKSSLPRLASPIRFKSISTRHCDSESPEDSPSKASVEQPKKELPVKPADPALHVQRTLQRRIPEVQVRALGRPPEKGRDKQAAKVQGLAHSKEDVPSQRPLSTPQDSRKTKYDGDSLQPVMKSLEKETALFAQQYSRSPFQSNEEGAALDVPIEIEDSQHELSQATISPGKSADKSSHHAHKLRVAASFEEINSSSFYAHARKHREDRDKRAPPSRDSSPMLMDAVGPAEPHPDFINIDSPTSDAMAVDPPSRAIEVSETPEPDDGFFQGWA